MSQHPSLKISKAAQKMRTVLKRYEKFFALKEKGILKDSSSVFGMPKLKIVKTKIRKEKPEEKPEEGEAVVSEEKVSPEAGTKSKQAPKGAKEEKGKKDKK